MNNIDLAKEFLSGTLEGAIRDLVPGGELEPMFFFEGTIHTPVSRKDQISAVPMPGLGDKAQKERGYDLMALGLLGTEALWYALVMEAWMTMIHPDDLDADGGPKIMPSESESREEVVTITMASRDGEKQVAFYRIKRDKEGKRSLGGKCEFGEDYRVAMERSPAAHLFERAADIAKGMRVPRI